MFISYYCYKYISLCLLALILSKIQNVLHQFKHNFIYCSFICSFISRRLFKTRPHSKGDRPSPLPVITSWWYTLLQLHTSSCQNDVNKTYYQILLIILHRKFVIHPIKLIHLKIKYLNIGVLV